LNKKSVFVINCTNSNNKVIILILILPILIFVDLLFVFFDAGIDTTEVYIILVRGY